MPNRDVRIWFGSRRFVGVVGMLLIATFLACSGDEDDLDSPQPFERGPDVPIIIESGEPIIIGTSTALTGPIRSRGEEYRDAVALAVKLWTEENGELIAGHEVRISAEDDGCGLSDVAAVAAERFVETRRMVRIR